MGIFDSLRKSPTVTTPDGYSPDTAIVVEAVRDEYAWLRQHYPDWQLGRQQFTEIDGRSFDIVTVRSADGEERQVYFDITSLMGSAVPSSSTATSVPPATTSSATSPTNLLPLQRAYEDVAKHRSGIERDGLALRRPDHEGITRIAWNRVSTVTTTAKSCLRLPRLHTKKIRPERRRLCVKSRFAAFETQGSIGPTNAGIKVRV